MQRREGLEAVERQAVAAQGGFEVGQRREDALAGPALGVHQAVEHLETMVAHAQGIGIGEGQADGPAAGPVVLDDAVQLAADVLPGRPDARQDPRDDEVLQFLIKHGFPALEAGSADRPARDREVRPPAMARAKEGSPLTSHASYRDGAKLNSWATSGITPTLTARLVRPSPPPSPAAPADAALDGERIGDALLDASVEPDPPNRLAAPLDPELRGGLDPREPAAEVAGDHLRLVADQDQDAVVADPVLRTAPEREPAGIVGVVAQDRPVASQGVGDLGTLIPVAGEDEAPRVVHQAELPDPAGDLVPAVEVEGRVGPVAQEAPASRAAPLEPAGPELDERQDDQGHRQAGVGGQPPATMTGPRSRAARPSPGRASGRAAPGRSGPSGARPAGSKPPR